MRVGLVFGGRSVEHLISIRSARTVRDGLQQAGHDVVCLGIAESGAWLSARDSEQHLLHGTGPLPQPPGALAASLKHLLEAAVDVIFPIVHGTYGEDGALQGLCEMLDLPYVGASVTTSAIAMDKLASKRLFEAVGLPVVPFHVVTRSDFERDAAASTRALMDQPMPLFVKPSVGGSSVGCKKVHAPGELPAAIAFALQFDDVVLVETGVSAREIEVAVLGGDAPSELRPSVVGEIVPGADFYDYADKYLKDDAKLLAPAPLSTELSDRVRALAVRAYGAIGGTGLARVDFFLLGDGTLYLNEINTLPGFTSASMYPRLWALTGVPLGELTDTLLRRGLERHAARKALDDGTRAFVASVMQS
jgi:D-alanine-D-alanine ligase